MERVISTIKWDIDSALDKMIGDFEEKANNEGILVSCSLTRSKENPKNFIMNCKTNDVKSFKKLAKRELGAFDFIEVGEIVE